MKKLKNTIFVTCLGVVLVSNLGMGNWLIDTIAELNASFGSGCVITIKNLTKEAKIRVEAMDYIWDTDENLPLPLVVYQTGTSIEYVRPKQDLRHVWHDSAIGSNKEFIRYTLVIDTGDEEKSFEMNFLDENKTVLVGERSFEVQSALSKKFIEIGSFFTRYRNVVLSVSDSESGSFQTEL